MLNLFQHPIRLRYGGPVQFNLIPHPAHRPATPDLKLWANVEHSAAFGAMATLNIWFGVGAPASKFAVSQATEPARKDELWRTTCFEAFLRPAGGDAYEEWNFAPSGDWAAYHFTGYREGMREAEVGAPPYIRMEDNLTWWTVGATIALEAGAQWELGLSAVLEDSDGAKSYWALAHPSDRPDFHHPDCFVAKLP
jgi:hypothetical protein